MLQVAGDALLSGAHYAINNQTRALELDGHQQLLISSMSYNRSMILQNQIKLIPHAAGQFNYSVIPLALMVIKLASMICPIVPLRNRVFVSISGLIQRLDNVVNKVLQHANKIINIACCVTYVALIAFGYTITGVVGLAGLFLILMKSYGYMPQMAEKILDPICHIGAVYAICVTPQNMFLKVVSLLGQIPVCFMHLTKHSFISALVPQRYRENAPGEHLIDQRRSLAAMQGEPNGAQRILEAAQRNFNFVVNTSSVHAREVSQIFPADYERSLDQISMTDLINAIEARWRERQIVLNDNQQQGWNRMKQALITGRVVDVSPPNFHEFQKVMKAMLKSILEDNQNFESKSREMAEIGQQCVEGWTREIKFLLLPQTQDAKWNVHHQLSVFRGHLINESILEMDHRLDMRTEDERRANPLARRSFMQIYGGNNNVHILNLFQIAMWHRYRPYEAEVQQQINGRNLLQYAVYRKMRRGFSEDLTMSELIFSSLLINLPELISFLPIAFQFIRQKMRQSYTVPDLVGQIYDGIKPEYPVAGEARRKIEWGGIQTWLAEFSERTGVAVLDENSDIGFNPAIVTQDDHGSLYLTQTGVRLLLWDMGVIDRI